jgi:hypothetical protein
MIGFRNRAAVLVNWSWNYLTYDHSAHARRVDDSDIEVHRTSGGE